LAAFADHPINFSEKFPLNRRVDMEFRLINQEHCVIIIVFTQI